MTTRTIWVLLLLPACWLSCSSPPVVYAQKKEIIEAVYASGKIVPRNEYELSAQTTGTIIKKLVQDGDTVVKGQVLYIIQHDAADQKLAAAADHFSAAATNISENSPILADLRLSLQNAAVKLKNDSTNYYRLKNLWDQQVGTRHNLDNAYSNYQQSLNQKKIAEQKYAATRRDMQVSYSQARSQLTAARKDLEQYFITSNASGVVYQAFKETGESVRANEVVALLGESDNHIIRLAVDQQDIDKIRRGQQVLLQADATGNKIYEATVSYIYPVMNETDQTFRVDAVFNTPPAQSFIHSSIEANIIIQKKKEAWVLPRTALADKDSVWVRVNGKAKKQGVQTGIATLDYVEIVSGLDEKTAVIAIPKQ